MTVLIIPGLHGSEPSHWQSRWQFLLTDTKRVEQADWHAPDLTSWLKVLAADVAHHPGSILVGHSLGALLIAHLSARHPELTVGGALLVAPVDPERGRNLPSTGFGPLPREPLRFPSILVASRNDPLMAWDDARILASRWKASFVDAGHAGHINTASGLGDWLEGLRLLEQLRHRPDGGGAGEHSLRPPRGAPAGEIASGFGASG